jgi:sulfate transport system substrate-binding protein
MLRRLLLVLAPLAVTVPLLSGCARKDEIELLNVSYDPTRELYGEINEAFVAQYQREHGVGVRIRMSNGGSGGQSRAVIDGLEADVVTLALWNDVDAIRDKGKLLNDGWEDRLPNRSLPYVSTIVFVVRRGNPKNVRDWRDLENPSVQVITPNPKTSGNGRLSFLAAWGAVKHRGGSDEEAEAFVRQLYNEQVPKLDLGARAATQTFVSGMGDVHLTWENEAHLEVAESNGALTIVYPKVSIRAEPYVAVIDDNVDHKGTRAVAEAYLRFLYTPEGQVIIARHHYRPIDPEVLRRHEKELPPIELFTVETVAGSWREAQDRFFGSNGVFDRIYQKQ